VRVKHRAERGNKPAQGGIAHLRYIGTLVLLVRRLASMLETGFVLVRVGRHETLNGNENRLKPLCRRPLFTSLAAPCPEARCKYLFQGSIRDSIICEVRGLAYRGCICTGRRASEK